MIGAGNTKGGFREKRNRITTIGTASYPLLFMNVPLENS